MVKWKSHLNVHGGKQEYSVNNSETYSPAVKWESIRMLLTLSIINYWHTHQVGFVMAYPQSPIEFDLYMELPHGVETREGRNKTHILKLLKKLYRQKQADRFCNQYPISELTKLGFVCILRGLLLLILATSS